MRLLLLGLMSSFSILGAAEQTSENFIVTVEPNESITITGTPSFTFGYLGGVFVAEDATSTMDFQSESGTTKVLNVRLDAVVTGLTISTWVDTTGATGTGTNTHTSSGTSLALTTSDQSIFTGLDDYSFTGKTVGYKVEADPSAAVGTSNLVATWTIATS